MIHIVHVLTRTNIGGPSVMLADLLNGLDRERFTQTVVRGQTVASEGDYLAGRAVNAEVVTIGGLRRSLGIVDEVRSLITLVRTLRRLQPDVVHTHMAKAGVLGRVAAVLAGVPIRVHTFHGHLLHGYFSRPVTRLFTWIERLLNRITTHTLVVGERTRADLLHARVLRSATSASILPAATPLTRYARDEARTTLGLPTGTELVGFVGRLTSIKRPDRFVALARAIPTARFVVVGDGPLRDDILRSAADLDNLIVLEWSRDVGLVLSALDLLVLTSDNEGVPLSLIEAASAGVPVVAMNVGGVSEIVDHGVTGLLVPDDAALVSSVNHLLQHPNERRALGDHAAARIMERCSMDAYLSSHSRLYERLTSEPDI
jgi:glycosyltransferase involved in cell wall biosynthesis